MHGQGIVKHSQHRHLTDVPQVGEASKKGKTGTMKNHLNDGTELRERGFVLIKWRSAGSH